ncbi:MAG: hypothetical protein ABF868_12195 [Sporolactobacillus sp.]
MTLPERSAYQALVAHAGDVWVVGAEIAINIGRVNGSYFINHVAGGKLTDVTQSVPHWLKAVLGVSAYYLNRLVPLPLVHLL